MGWEGKRWRNAPFGNGKTARPWVGKPFFRFHVRLCASLHFAFLRRQLVGCAFEDLRSCRFLGGFLRGCFSCVPLLVALSQDFPLLETNVLSHSSSGVERLVQTQEIDFSMYCTCSVNGVALTSIPDNLRFTPLLPCRLYALIPNKLPLTVYKSVSIKSLLPYPLIMQRTGDDETPALLSLVKQFGKPKQVISKSSAALCHELVYAGIGIYLQIALHGKLPQIQDAKQVTILPIRDEIELTYGYLTAADNSLSATSEIILRYIQEQAEVMLNAPA